MNSWGSFTNYVDKILAFLTTSVDIFYLMNIDKKWTFLDHLPPFPCKRSLWTAPYPKIRRIFFFVKLQWASSRFSHLTFFFPYFREPLLSYDISRHRRRSGEQFRNDWIEPPFKRKFNQQQVGTSSQTFR